ncbi:MAG: ribonuclease Z [Deltaproteobacteria bacterium]|nr:ribonuclease Z [Deltaproteobacteria bacterium]
MSFEVIALGVGDTFSRVHHTTSLLLHKDGFYLGVDCPDSYRNVLRDAGDKCGRALDLFSVDDILLTHVHGDHMNGIEGVGFFKHFAEKKRLKLHTTEDVRSVIWDQRLRAPMERLWNGSAYRELSFDDYFDYRQLDWSAEATIGPFSIRIRRTIHHVPTCAILVRCDGRSLGYSSDTAFDPSLIDFLSAADLVIHETNYGPAHTAYKDLAALPEAARAKMRLIHYPDQLTDSVIPLVKEGEILVP